MLATTRSIVRPRFGLFIARMVCVSSTPVTFRSVSDWNLRTAAATVSSYWVLSAFSRDAKP